MKELLYLKQAEVEFITPQKEPDGGKRWSFSFVFFIEDLRNIYRLYDIFTIDSIPFLLQKCQENGIKSWSGKAWSQRNLLELVNALKNFHLLSNNNRVCIHGLFADTQPDDPLTNEEKNVFKGIYLSYFRFCEFHDLFLRGTHPLIIENLINSSPVVYYMQDSRFANRFILNANSPFQIVGLSDEHSDMMRFWDVYLKWGLSLNLLRKYPLKPFGINTIPLVKGLSIVYFVCEMPKEFSVFKFMMSEMEGSYQFIPDVVYSLIISRHYSVEAILDRIVEESISYPNVYRIQSTSAIFINDKESFLFPRIGNAYMTHLLKL